MEEKTLKDGEPCDHPGCLLHISHPCEGCGRVGGIGKVTPPDGFRLLKEYETIKAGDIYLRGGQWSTTNHTGGKWNPRGYWPMARKSE